MFLIVSSDDCASCLLIQACSYSTSVDIVLLVLLLVLMIERELICAYRGGQVEKHRLGLDAIVWPAAVVFALIVVRSLLELMNIVS